MARLLAPDGRGRCVLLAPYIGRMVGILAPGGILSVSAPSQSSHRFPPIDSPPAFKPLAPPLIRGVSGVWPRRAAIFEIRATRPVVTSSESDIPP